MQEDSFFLDELFPVAGEDLEAVPAAAAPGFWESRGAWVVTLLQDYPLVIWGALLAMAMVAAGLAVNGLMNPTLSRREELPGIPGLPEVSRSLAEEEPVDRGEFPLWSLGALVLSCAGATLLISRHLNWAKQREAMLSPLSLEELAAIQSGSAIALSDSETLYNSTDLEDEESLEWAEEDFEQDFEQDFEFEPADAPPRPLPLPVAPTPHRLPAAPLPPLVLPPPPRTTAEPPLPALPPAVDPPVSLPPWERSPLDYQAPGLAEVLEIQRRRSQKLNHSRSPQR